MSKRLIIDMDCGNAAFTDSSGGPRENEWARCIEAARILQDVVRKLECGHETGDMHDTNGNHVGSWRFINGRK